MKRPNNYVLVTLAAILFTLGGQWITLPLVIADLAEKGLLAHAGPLASLFSVAQLVTSPALLIFFKSRAKNKEAEMKLAKSLVLAATALSALANSFLFIGAQLGEIWLYSVAIMAHGALSSAFGTASQFLTRVLSKDPHEGYSRVLALKTPLSAIATYVAFMVELNHGVITSTLLFSFSLVFLSLINIEPDERTVMKPKEEEENKEKSEPAKGIILPVILAIAGMGTMIANISGNQMLALTFDRSTAGAIMSVTTVSAGFIQYVLTKFARRKESGNSLSILLVRLSQCGGLLFFYLQNPWVGVVFWGVAATHNTLLSHAIHERSGARVHGSVLLNTSWQVSGVLAGVLLWITGTSPETLHCLIILSTLSTVLSVVLWQHHMLKK